jgi:hypothetical protein
MMNTTNEQEPVAWMTKDGEIYKHDCWPELDARPLVFGDTTPPAAQPAQISPKQLLALAQTASLELDKVIEVFRMAAQPAPNVASPRVPLTQQQVVDGFCKTPHQTQYVAVFDAGVRFAENHHGITEKGQP